MAAITVKIYRAKNKLLLKEQLLLPQQHDRMQVWNNSILRLYYSIINAGCKFFISGMKWLGVLSLRLVFEGVDLDHTEEQTNGKIIILMAWLPKLSEKFLWKNKFLKMNLMNKWKYGSF